MTERIDHTLRGSWTPSGAADAALPPHALRWLRDRTGLAAASTPAGPDSVIAVGDSTLPDAARAALAALVGESNVLLDRDSRLGRAGGLSYVDLMRHRGAGELAVPDAVVLPADPDQVVEVLRACAAQDIGVVPFGGGTSVVGGVSALRGDKVAVVALDLARLDALVSVDPVSRIAVLQAGVRGPDAERLLAAHGLTIGHVPQSFERATIGGFAATRSAGQASAGYGRFEDMVEGLRLATPVGEWRLGSAPASAAGPDLRQLVVGSEGAFGVITEVALRVRPTPTERRYEGYVLDGWEAGGEAVRDLAQQRVLADITRLSDVDETEVSLALSGGWKSTALRGYLRARGIARPCLLILGWEAASPAEAAVRRAATLRVLGEHRTVRLGRPLGEAWLHGRFNGPRQRDALLDAGVCVETLETATHWSRLDELRDAVRAALVDALRTPQHRPVVMCHVSHAYETGASLYFTVLVPRSEQDPIGQWQQAKAAACAAISRIGTGEPPLGTISHHHAVGTDHAPYLAAEIGELGVDVLGSVKRTLDPSGILNPGKLLGQELLTR
ncbi:FAD-binding oxidoreductase [Solihabitans fulvus]|uniref:FAD-binding oxidoreductase n=1 Tax=Solihabitans fulvus TaxID=1892852 RepID=A0A5B2XJE2_9PSEU|nr:FAD-binding oxidoreductase [Solihabitans fulvus]KAA2263001.1 FAD-binding oxidoreductase [Solihabitans fulvus]